MIGSTDSHTSLPAVEENNFFGKHSGVEPSPERASHVVIGGENGNIMGYDMASSGFAAVWAKENTREAIFDAMAQERVYDVAVSDDRKIDANGRCNTPVGNTVNVEEAIWTAYEAKRFNIDMPKEVEMVTQERAYTSPIWYTPKT